MTAPLGSVKCAKTGCDRRRHTTAWGLKYGYCLAHTLERLHRAFAA